MAVNFMINDYKCKFTRKTENNVKINDFCFVLESLGIKTSTNAMSFLSYDYLTEMVNKYFCEHTLCYNRETDNICLLCFSRSDERIKSNRLIKNVETETKHKEPSLNITFRSLNII